MDPTLELYSGSTKIAENDNWKDSQEQEIRDTKLAPTDDRESVIVRTLDPGLYTAILRGKNGSEGIGVVEVYDGDLAVNPKLANLSTRGVVGAGDEVMIGGFIAGTSSTGPATTAIRAIGPSLARSGLNKTLQDPTLELINANGTTVESNDDWTQSPRRADIESAGLAPADSREAVILGTAAPGSYTAIVRGKNETGLALVEIYSLQ